MCSCLQLLISSCTVQCLGRDGGRRRVAKVRNMGVDQLILPEGSKASFVNFPGQHIPFIEERVVKFHYGGGFYVQGEEDTKYTTVLF